MRRVRRQPGVERRMVTGAHPSSANRCALAFPAVNAVNHALNEAESSVRVTIPSVSARFAFVRSADALASVTEDSVLHFAAA